MFSVRKWNEDISDLDDEDGYCGPFSVRKWTEDGEPIEKILDGLYPKKDRLYRRLSQYVCKPPVRRDRNRLKLPSPQL
ncbi:MAG: hypothetical protein PHE27_03730 [Alphaproteobacteria bacterium]|nr:hypothetical protein [Alphaproteobacteria bacterium]